MRITPEAFTLSQLVQLEDGATQLYEAAVVKQ